MIQARINELESSLNSNEQHKTFNKNNYGYHLEGKLAELERMKEHIFLRAKATSDKKEKQILNSLL